LSRFLKKPGIYHKIIFIVYHREEIKSNHENQIQNWDEN
jgi:hypothetical protein